MNRRAFFGGMVAAPFAALPVFAAGGGIAMTGERGPELVGLPRGVRISIDPKMIDAAMRRVLAEKGLLGRPMVPTITVSNEVHSTLRSAKPDARAAFASLPGLKE